MEVSTLWIKFYTKGEPSASMVNYMFLCINKTRLITCSETMSKIPSVARYTSG